jgi:hypothetical protein
MPLLEETRLGDEAERGLLDVPVEKQFRVDSNGIVFCEGGSAQPLDEPDRQIVRAEIVVLSVQHRKRRLNEVDIFVLRRCLNC